MTTTYHTPIPKPGDAGYVKQAVNAAKINSPLGELDTAIGDLTTRLATSIDGDGTLVPGAVDVAAVLADGVVSAVKFAGTAIPSSNLSFDPHNTYYAPTTSAQDGRVRWFNSPSLDQITPDTANPFGCPTIRMVDTDYGGRRNWLADMRLRIGDTVSFAILAKVATGRSVRAIAKFYNASLVARGDYAQSDAVAGDDGVHLLTIDNVTVPATGGDVALVDLYIYTAAGSGTVDVYGWYVVRGERFLATLATDGESDGQRAQAAVRAAAGTAADLDTRLSVQIADDGSFLRTVQEDLRRAYLRQPNRHFLDGRDVSTAEDWAFSRAATKIHPQTGETLAENVRAEVAAFPRQIGADVVTRYRNVGDRNDNVYQIAAGVWYGARGAKLITSADQGETWTVVVTFDANVQGVLVTASGAILVSLANQLVKRSADAGATWATVLTLASDSYGRWPAFTHEGTHVYVGEYGTAPDAASGNVYRSVDDGVTFAAIASLGSVVRHIHFVREDPYTGDIWFGTGDGNDQAYVKRSTDGGSTWTTIASGSQEARCTDIRFDATYAYLGGDGVLADTDHYGNFRVTKADNTWARLRDDFDHAFYTVEWDPFGRLWFVGAAQDQDGYRMPYSNIYILDHDQFIEVARFPIVKALSGGVVRIVFDDTTTTAAAASGWSLPWSGTKILNPYDFYWRGIDMQDTEVLSSALYADADAGAAFCIALIMEDAYTGKYATGTYTFALLQGRNSAFDYVMLTYTSAKPTLTKGVLGQTAVNLSLTANTAPFGSGDVVIFGGVVDSAGRMTLMALTQNYGFSATRSANTSWFPTALGTVYLGCRANGTYGAEAAILEAQFWQHGATEGEVEAYMQAMAYRLWPDGVYHGAIYRAS